MTNLDNILKSRDITLPTKAHLQSYGFSSSHARVWELGYEESWVLKNWCFWTVVLEKTLILLWAVRRSKQSILIKAVLHIFWKVWCWSWNSNTLATWCKELTPWKTPWCWERLKAAELGDDRGWDLGGITNSMNMVWANFVLWWWTEKPGMLQSIGSQNVGHDRVTELNWTERYAAYLHIWRAETGWMRRLLMLAPT